MASATVLEGDCLVELAKLEAESVDACVTDPPYELGFMGKTWDQTGVAFHAETWRAVLRVLKPGGHLVAFGGTRTYHRMACAVEDAGFEVRDQIGWLFGQGFPKSHNIDGGWGTALKPAWEPIILARKPLTGTVAENVQAHGTGALNIDGCRIPTLAGDDIFAKNPHTHGGFGHANAQVYGAGKGSDYKPQAGRWPANIVHDGSEEVLAAFPETASGELRPYTERHENATSYQFARVKTYASDANFGSAARFFYTAKANAKDRNGSKHPTVKPIALMRWLVRLVTPPGGLVLDPFAGTGTCGQAALEEGFDALLIEREPEYIEDIQRRLVSAEAPTATPALTLNDL